jgi:hypothetical protein
MADDHGDSPLAREVTDLYLGLMAALHGANRAAARSALAMAIVITGERSGLAGQPLLDWIDTIATAARSAVLKPPPRQPQ